MKTELSIQSFFFSFHSFIFDDWNVLIPFWREERRQKQKRVVDVNRSTAAASASDCNFATSRWWNQGSESCCRLPDWIVNLPHLDKRGQPSLWIRPAISTTVTKNGRRRRSSAIDEQKFFDRYSLLVARPPLVNLFIIHWAISSLNFRLIGSSFNSYTLRTPKWSKERGKGGCSVFPPPTSPAPSPRQPSKSIRFPTEIRSSDTRWTHFLAAFGLGSPCCNSAVPVFHSLESSCSFVMEQEIDVWSP